MYFTLPLNEYVDIPYVLVETRKMAEAAPIFESTEKQYHVRCSERDLSIIWGG